MPFNHQHWGFSNLFNLRPDGTLIRFHPSLAKKPVTAESELAKTQGTVVLRVESWAMEEYGDLIREGLVMVVEKHRLPDLRELRADGKVIWGDTTSPHDQIYFWRGRHFRVFAKTLKVEELT